MASITGRYYAMDRDNRWERVKLAYDAMVKGAGKLTANLYAAVEESYADDVTDEFIKPIIKTNEQGQPLAKIKEGDVVICFNFRTDRGREITQALTQKDFAEQQMQKMNLHYVTLTNYDNTFENVKVIFEKDNLNNTLGEVLEAANKHQIRIAETEKVSARYIFLFGRARETL